MASNATISAAAAELVFPGKLYRALEKHLFPGDHDEHGAIIAAGIAKDHAGRVRLLARDLFLAKDGIDYVPGKYGYRMLRAEFIYERIRYCREQGLAYLAIHNHFGQDAVAFSEDDLASHERGYPALLDIMQGLPVGALVFARNSVAGDIWISSHQRLALDKARIVGEDLVELIPGPRDSPHEPTAYHDRQILLFGAKGQERLNRAHVGIVGLGGVGSMIAEYLARLGIGRFTIVDNDVLEPSNISRVVGATIDDLDGSTKIDIAKRVIYQAQPKASVEAIFDTFAIDAVARRFAHCDFLFLAADSMQARLVFNAIIHQFLIPGIQVGTKIIPTESGRIDDAYTVVRWVLPDSGCLWCNGLISRHGLAWEGKNDHEREKQHYGTNTANPSVITMNAVGAAHAVNDFLMYFQGLTRITPEQSYLHFNHLRRTRSADEPRRDQSCPECGSTQHSRMARGEIFPLPTLT